MKVNMKALFSTGAIPCVHVVFDEDTGEELRNDSQLAFVTESTVAAAREIAKRDSAAVPGESEPDVTYGCAVAISQDDNGKSIGQVVQPGENSDYFLEMNDGDFSLTGDGMLVLREKILHMMRSDETLELSQSHRNALGGIQDIFEMVSAVPDEERFPAGLISQAFMASMADSFGDGKEIELPVSDEEFSAKSRADLYRARIGNMDPSHPDGIASAGSLREFLATAGIDVTTSGVGVEIRGSIASSINEETMRRLVLSNDRMCREVFGALTATPIERLSAAVIQLSDLEVLRQGKAQNRLSGDWIDKATTTAGNITRNGMPGYVFEMDVFSEGGRDIMTISDNVGRQNGVAYVYSWPNADRIPYSEIDSGRVLNISPEEIPDKAEIERLQEVIRELEAVHEAEPAAYVH